MRAAEREPRREVGRDDVRVLKKSSFSFYKYSSISWASIQDCPTDLDLRLVFFFKAGIFVVKINPTAIACSVTR